MQSVVKNCFLFKLIKLKVPSTRPAVPSHCSVEHLVFRKEVSSVPPNFLKFYNSYKIATFFDLKCFTCKSFILSVVFRKNFSWSVVFRNSKKVGNFF
jgi:hypothetical protein